MTDPTEASALTPLRYALVVVGVIFVVGIFILMQVWPAGWQWQPNQAEYEQMILGVYATLGVFLLVAARDPLEHLSLIWFTVWSSVVHGGIMLWQALVDPAETSHLYGDVPALFVVAIVLGWLTKRAQDAASSGAGTAAAGATGPETPPPAGEGASPTGGGPAA